MSEVALCRLSDLPQGHPMRFDPEGVPVVATRLGDEVFALDDVCSHAHFLLSEGEVWEKDRTIECPKHGALFSLVTGDAVTMPATRPVASYPIQIRDGDVLITLPTDGEESE